MDFDSLDDFIAATERFEDRLRKPSDFYVSHAGRHLEIARSIAHGVLSVMRPPDSDPDRWERRVREIVDAVTIHMLSTGDGARLSIAERPAGSLPDKDERSGIEAITFEDVMAWIEAGLDGEPGGKLITPEDEANLASEAGRRFRASIIMKAYYGLEPKPEWQALRQHIQRWMRGVDGAEPDKLHATVARAWQDQMQIVLEDDLKRWLAAVGS